jgi:hypothetical protein
MLCFGIACLSSPQENAHRARRGHLSAVLRWLPRPGRSRHPSARLHRGPPRSHRSRPPNASRRCCASRDHPLRQRPDARVRSGPRGRRRERSSRLRAKSETRTMSNSHVNRFCGTTTPGTRPGTCRHGRGDASALFSRTYHRVRNMLQKARMNHRAAWLFLGANLFVLACSSTSSQRGSTDAGNSGGSSGTASGGAGGAAVGGTGGAGGAAVGGTGGAGDAGSAGANAVHQVPGISYPCVGGEILQAAPAVASDGGARERDGGEGGINPEASTPSPTEEIVPWTGVLGSCIVGVSYCAIRSWQDGLGVPPSSSCKSLPAACADTPNCNCVCSHGVQCYTECSCKEDASGAAIVACEQV